MAKLDFNNSVFVVKVYEHTIPLIVEVFPATEQGISDALSLYLFLLIYSANYKPINISNYESKSRL